MYGQNLCIAHISISKREFRIHRHQLHITTSKNFRAYHQNEDVIEEEVVDAQEELSTTIMYSVQKIKPTRQPSTPGNILLIQCQ